MNNHPQGFSLLALLMVIISICLIVSSIVAMRVNTETHTLKSQQSFFTNQNELDQQMKTLLASLFFDKATKPLTVSTQNNTIYSNAIDYVVTPQHIYDGIYQVTASAHSLSDSYPLTQEVQVGAFNLVNKVPSQVSHYVKNNELHHVLLHQIAESSDLLAFIAKFARLHHQDCSALSEDSFGLLLVTGSCHLQSITLGNTTRPVMLVVADGDVTFGYAVKLHGLFIHLCFEQHTALLSTTEKHAVNGLLLTSCNTAVDNDLVVPSVSTLQAWVSHNDNKKLEVITGSWMYR